jgi:TATA-binding protein-associated factor
VLNNFRTSQRIKYFWFNFFETYLIYFYLLGYLGSEKQFYFKYAKFITHQSASFQRNIERSTLEQSSRPKNNSKSETENNGCFKNSGDKANNELSIIALESLHKQVLPFLLRRTKEEVLKDLPPKIIQDYYCEMSYIQCELYQDFANSDASKHFRETLGLDDEEEKPQDKNLDEEKSSTSNGYHVFQALHYLRKVVNHPSLVLKRDHPKWNSVQSYLQSSRSSLSDYKHSGKLIALRELLFECGIGVSSNNFDENDQADFNNGENILNQHRVLIFCQIKSMIDIIENELLKKMENVTFLRLDGTIQPSDRYTI